MMSEFLGIKGSHVVPLAETKYIDADFVGSKTVVFGEGVALGAVFRRLTHQLLVFDSSQLQRVRRADSFSSDVLFVPLRRSSRGISRFRGICPWRRLQVLKNPVRLRSRLIIEEQRA